MSAQGHARLAWSLLVAFVLMVAGAVALTALSGESAIEGNDYAAFGWVAVFAPFPIVGALIASRRAGGALGWICIAVGLAVGLTVLTQRYAMYSVVAEPGAFPAGEYLAYVENWSWVVPIGLIGVFLVLVFPDGKLPSRAGDGWSTSRAAGWPPRSSRFRSLRRRASARFPSRTRSGSSGRRGR